MLAVVPDFFDGDAVPHEHLNGIVPNLRVQAEKSAVERAAAGVKATASYGPWAVRHRDAVVVSLPPSCVRHYDKLTHINAYLRNQSSRAFSTLSKPTRRSKSLELSVFVSHLHQ